MLTLPLKERATPHHPLFRLLPDGELARTRTASAPLIPTEPLEEGEHYRFHFDMSKCIGCHCCEVACSEQNNLPPQLPWRRVGEIEGGEYPLTQRFHLSMGCNHCLEPACLTGCPVDAYTKNADTGVVVHNTDACIGCQYCIWNCPYGVPQFNPERGIVGKCDMCHNRLAEGRAPACVSACPESAIRIEAVNPLSWREDFDAANAPGLPDASVTISTTRVTLPKKLENCVERVDTYRVKPEHPHFPLIAMTVLVQCAIGAFSMLWSVPQNSRARFATSAVLTACFAINLSVLHLGRPAFAWRALKMWRRSRLSREVLLFTCFATAGVVLVPLLWRGSSLTSMMAALVVLLGWASVYANARVYLLPARPAWNSLQTTLEFSLTCLILGPLFVLQYPGSNQLLRALSAAAVLAQLVNLAGKYVRFKKSQCFELNASAQLLGGILRPYVLWRLALGFTGAALCLTGYSAIAFAVLLVSELLGRWLFFVSVVPTNIASKFLGMKEAA